MSDIRLPDRGDVYRVNLRGTSHELRGPHYAVVISDYPYTRLSTVAIVPFSSQARSASYHPETIIDGTRTRALVEQLTAISRARLGELVGSVAGTAVMDEIDEQLKYFLGLES